MADSEIAQIDQKKDETMRPKKPVLKRGRQEYPTLKECKVDRRKFLALLGGSVASSALVSASCEENGLGHTYAGVPPASQYYERRLPASGFDTLFFISDHTIVIYAIATHFEEWSFQQAPEQELLLAVGQKLSANFDGHEFADEETLPSIEKMAQEALETAFKTYEGIDPAFIDVSLVVERIDYH